MIYFDIELIIETCAMKDAIMTSVKNTAATRTRQTWIIPVASLLGAGAMLGLSTNMARLAVDTGLSALAFLTWSTLGATLILGASAALRGHVPPLNRRTLEYFVVAALVTVAGSNLIFFSAVPTVGVAFVSLIITLPPLLTYVGALALSMERFHALRATGVLAALAGAAVLALNKLDAPDASVSWILLTLCGPVLLAIGNLYRTLRWPTGVSAEALAPGMLGAATAMLLLASLIPGFTLAVPTANGAALWLIIGQSAVFALQFLLMFILQRTGGPVFLSLLGAVGAVVGVPTAVWLLGEVPPDGLLAGASLIALGIACVFIGGIRVRRRA